MPVLYTLISFQFEDNEDHIMSVPVRYVASEVNTVAEAQGIVDTLAPLISAVSGVAITGAKVQFPLTAPGGDTVDAGYRNDAGATLSFLTVAGVSDSLYVPGLLLSRMAGGKVDPTAPDMGNLINALVAGGGITGGFIACDENGVKYASYRDGNQSTRK